MSEKATILVQLDTDAQPSAFDRVVAVDSGVQHLFSYGGITPNNVVPLVHGCIFTPRECDFWIPIKNIQSIHINFQFSWRQKII